jgi:response regulator NasT
MDAALRIVLVDENPARAGELERALVACGYTVVARLGGRDDLRARIAALAPDVIIVDMASPDRDVLEGMRRLHGDTPRPVVMFVGESDSDSIRAAVRAGVSAYVVDGVATRSVAPIVEVAIARFEAFQALRDELATTREQLEDRKFVERAKGILMRRRGLSEEEAFRLLRKTAMDRKVRLGEVARRLVSLEDLP